MICGKSKCRLKIDSWGGKILKFSTPTIDFWIFFRLNQKEYSEMNILFGFGKYLKQKKNKTKSKNDKIRHENETKMHCPTCLKRRKK